MGEGDGYRQGPSKRNRYSPRVSNTLRRYRTGFVAFGRDTSETLEPVVWQRVLWQGSTVRESGTIVDIVTAEQLEAYGRMMHGALIEVASVLGAMAPRPEVSFS